MSQRQIVTCKDEDQGARRLIRGSFAEGADPPEEFQVFPFGLVDLSGEEPFLVDEEAMNSVILDFESSGLDMVIDYEHQTEGGEWSSPDGTAPAAGWIGRLENRGPEGIWATAVRWTERAGEFLSRKEYRYYSPVFVLTNKGRRLVKLLRVALTNAPRLNAIRPIVARATDESMKEDEMEFFKRIAKLLGLSETATEDQVIEALTEKDRSQASPVVAKEVLSALGLTETANQSEVVATIHAIMQKPDLTTEVASLKRRLAERDRDDLVDQAMKDGKITPAQKEWADAYALGDPDGFRIFLAKAPAVIPTDHLNVAGKLKKTDSVDPDQANVNRLMGISDETWKKYNQ